MVGLCYISRNNQRGGGFNEVDGAILDEVRCLERVLCWGYRHYDTVGPSHNFHLLRVNQVCRTGAHKANGDVRVEHDVRCYYDGQLHETCSEDRDYFIGLREGNEADTLKFSVLNVVQLMAAAGAIKSYDWRGSRSRRASQWSLPP